MSEKANRRAALKTAIVSFLMLILWLVVWYVALPLPPVLMSVLLLLGLSSISWFDFDHYRIPNWISYPLILTGLGLAFVRGVNVLGWHMLGVLIGYGFVWVLNLYWQRRHGKAGIGMGDAKLLAAAGAWLGPLTLPFVTLIASGTALLGIVLTKVFLRRTIDVSMRIAFGPYIAIGFWSIWLWSPI